MTTAIRVAQNQPSIILAVIVCVCVQRTSYPNLSSWRKSHFHSLRLGEHKKHKSVEDLGWYMVGKLFDAVKSKCGLLFNRQNMLIP